MENTCEKDELESSPAGVFAIPGEPAIVINGVPPVTPSGNTPVFCHIANDTEPNRSLGFGEWLEGREVRKLFGDHFYNGKVTKFDKESGWYRVVYEDGDFEDLEWHELEEVLVPLDITIPLRALALKMIKKKQRPINRSGKTVSRPKNEISKSVVGNRKNAEEVLEEGSSKKNDSSPQTNGAVQH